MHYSSATYNTAWQNTTLHCTALHYTTLHYTTLHYTTPHHTTPHYTTLHYTTLHYTTLHYTTLHYTTLHYTTLHHTTLHCTSMNVAAEYLTVEPDQHSTADRPLLSPFKAFISLVRDDTLAGVKEVEAEVEVEEALGRSIMCTHTLYGTAQNKFRSMLSYVMWYDEMWYDAIWCDCNRR